MPKVHDAIGDRNEFVCEPSNNYRDNCSDPGWKGRRKGENLALAAFQYVLKRTLKDDAGKVTGYEYYKVPWEAHHMLSVSCVNNLDGLDSDQKQAVRRCCDATTWNINNSDNLIALPLFGHTIKWYAIDCNEEAPGWANWPQHDWDHNSTKGYCNDVRDEILEFYRKLEKKSNEHEIEKRSIASNLKTMETRWRGLIKKRGSKGRGTHEEWKNKGEGWYKPFSMADDGNETYRPPLRIDNKTDKLIKLLEEWSPS